MRAIQRAALQLKTELGAKSAQADSNLAATPHSKAMFYKLNSDIAKLKKIASMQAKAAVKSEILPDYLPYIDGLMAAGGMDDVLAWCMIWAFDAGDLDKFEQLARYALANGGKMPAGFDRPLGSFLAETVAKWTIKQFDDADTPEPMPTPLALWLLDETKTTDMHDEIRAKLYVACAYLVQSDNPVLALEYYTTALTFDPHIRIKRKIKAIKESLSPLGQADDLAATGTGFTPAGQPPSVPAVN